MTSKLTGTAALVTGASSGIGAATARRLAEHGASVALVARRLGRMEAVAAEIDKAGGTTLVLEADITDRTQAEAAVQQAVERFGRLDTLVNNAGLMLLGPVVAADAINVQGLLYTTRAALPHLLQAAEEGPRRVADIVNISSIAGRVAWNGYAVYNLTKFGVNGFTESLAGWRGDRAGLAQQARGPQRDDRPLLRADRGPRLRGHRRRRRLYGHPPRHVAIGELWIMPTDQV